jgi:hypothetical protein
MFNALLVLSWVEYFVVIKFEKLGGADLFGTPEIGKGKTCIKSLPSDYAIGIVSVIFNLSL